MSATHPALDLLVVAGHDSSGGAGVDADRDAAEALGLRAAFVPSARTVQGASGLRRLDPVAPERWSAEVRAALVFGARAIKLGLLPGPTHVAAATALAREATDGQGARPPVVLDPVLAPTLGGRFVPHAELDAWTVAAGELDAVWTPNLPELAELTGVELQALEADLEAREEAARALLARGARAVVVKGGHGREDPVVDLVVERERSARRLARPRQPCPGMRGTGCRHATVLAAGLGAGLGLASAAERAARFVAGRLAGA